MIRYAFCLLLLCTSTMVSARDVRMHGANGDGGACAEPTSAPSAPITPAAKPAAVSATGHAKAKTPPLFRGGDDDSTPHMPRWHSFLPGMFR